MSYGEIKAIIMIVLRLVTMAVLAANYLKIKLIYGRRSTTISLWESRAQASSKNTAPNNKYY